MNKTDRFTIIARDKIKFSVIEQSTSTKGVARKRVPYMLTGYTDDQLATLPWRFELMADVTPNEDGSFVDPCEGIDYFLEDYVTDNFTKLLTLAKK
jgi:hypothetical protein